MSAKEYAAGVRAYRENYWGPSYELCDSDLLACFKIVAQEGMPRYRGNA